MHLKHHQESGQVTDAEERLIGLGLVSHGTLHLYTIAEKKRLNHRRKGETIAADEKGEGRRLRP